MITRIFKKQCSCCGKKTRKNIIKFADHYICSEECMVDFFYGLTLEEITELEERDKIINKDSYLWLENYDKWNSKYSRLIKIMLLIMIPITISDIVNKDYVSILIDIFVVTANLVALKDNK